MRERGIGPWSLGVICLEGLGSYRYGLVGDLGLIKLLRGAAWAPGGRLEETRELLAPYEEWAGLACVYLMRGWARVPRPGASADRARLAARPGSTRGLSFLDSKHGFDPRRIAILGAGKIGEALIAGCSRPAGASRASSRRPRAGRSASAELRERLGVAATHSNAEAAAAPRSS